MANISTVLKKLNKSWDDAEPQESQFVSLDDGSYDGVARSLQVELSKNGRLQINYLLEVTEGDSEGESFRKFDGLDNEISMGFAKATLKLLGITIPKKLDELPGEIEDWHEKNPLGVSCMFVLKTQGEFQNCYINSVSGEEPPPLQNEKSGKSGKKEKKKDKKKKLTMDDLNEMDKDNLLDLIDKEDLDIDNADDLRERKLRRAVAEELDIEEE